MLPPAFAAMTLDAMQQRASRLTKVRIRVWFYLLTTCSTTEPRQCKVWSAAQTLNVSRQQMVDALAWLTNEGVMEVTDRDERGVRTIQLVAAVAPAKPPRPLGEISVNFTKI